jgi:hypothetical protein
MIDGLHLDQYLVTSSGKFTCLGRTTHYDDRVIGEDMPTTLEGAAQMAFAECVDCTSIRVLRLNYSESGFTDVTEQVTEYVAYNLIDHQNEDVSPPEWAESAFDDFRSDRAIQMGL